MAGQHYCLRWNNYQSNMTSVFHHLLCTEAFVDVTLACKNDSLKAHKVVLSACSSYFQKILLDNPSQHPTIIMPQDVCFRDLKFIIEFVYRGEIDVSQSELQSLLKTADQLKIKGLCEVPEGSDSKDMPGAEVTPLLPQPQHVPASPVAMVSRVNRFRKLSVQAKRRLDSRKRLYRETLQQQQKQQVQINQVQQTQTVHQVQTIHQQTQQTVHLQNQQTIQQNQPNLHPTQHHTQQNLHQTQQNIHQAQQIHQTQQSMHQSQQNIHQTQQNVHQQQQNVHQTQQLVHQQQTVLQPHQTVLQTQQQTLQHHSQNHQEPSQQTQMIQAVVTTVRDPTSPHNQITTADTLTNCITVATSTDDDLKDEMPGVVILESNVGHNAHLTHTEAIMMTSPPPIMSTHAHTLPTSQHQQVLLESTGLTVHSDVESLTTEVSTQNTSSNPSLISSPTQHQEMSVMTPAESRVAVDSSPVSPHEDTVKVKYETLRTMEQTDINIDAHISSDRQQENGQLSQNNTEDSPEHTMHTMMITPELLGLIPSSSTGHQEVSDVKREIPTSKTWTQEDMDAALDALRSHSMSLTKASITYGIPSTTLWQRAHRLGIDTPKKDGPAKSWTEDVLNVALEALRNGSISANKASKAYGIPSSTLYKIARREGIRLAAPFNAAPTTWSPEDLERALEAIRSGQTTVQRAAADYGIPSGTLYGRCKREGIELSRSNPTPWSEDAMTEALEAVRLGQMSINQAAIHYNLPYSSLYGRFKRVKYEADHPTETEELPLPTHHSLPGQIMLVQYQQPTLYQHTPS